MARFSLFYLLGLGLWPGATGEAVGAPPVNDVNDRQLRVASRGPPSRSSPGDDSDLVDFLEVPSSSSRNSIRRETTVGTGRSTAEVEISPSGHVAGIHGGHPRTTSRTTSSKPPVLPSAGCGNLLTIPDGEDYDWVCETIALTTGVLRKKCTR